MAESAKARGANFTAAELNQLVGSWLHVSQDPIVGNGQKLGAFWDRTLKHYNENRPADRECRNVRSLETKWSEVKRDVAKFCGCFQATVDANQSGTSLEDTIRKSKELYVVKDSKGKDFMYIEQWHLLRHCERFAMTIDDMNQKASQKKARKQKGKGRNAVDRENESPNVESLIDLSVDDEPEVEGQRGPRNEPSETNLHFGEQRPMGNKVARKLRADESSTKLMAAAQRDMAAICAKRLKLAEKQDRESILTLRVADVDEECRAYFRMARAKELRIAMLKLQREEEEETRALQSTRRTPLPFAPPAVGVQCRDRGSTVPEGSPIINSPSDVATLQEGSPNATSSNNHDEDLAELDRELAFD